MKCNGKLADKLQVRLVVFSIHFVAIRGDSLSVMTHDEHMSNINDLLLTGRSCHS